MNTNHINPDSEARREGARQADGKFGPQEHEEPVGGMYSLGLDDMLSEFDAMVEDTRLAEANRAAREAYPEVYDGELPLMTRLGSCEYKYTGALGPVKKAYIATYGIEDDLSQWSSPDTVGFDWQEALEHTRIVVSPLPGGKMFVGANGCYGIDDTEDGAWRYFIAADIEPFAEDPEGSREYGPDDDHTEANFAKWVHATNARQDRLDEYVEQYGGEAFNALARAGEEPFDVKTKVVLECDGHSELSAVHGLAPNGYRITPSDVAANPGYYRGVIAGVTAAYGLDAGWAAMESIQNSEYRWPERTFENAASINDVIATVEKNVPPSDGSSEQNAVQDEYLLGAQQALCDTNGFWGLGVEDTATLVSDKYPAWADFVAAMNRRDGTN